MFKLVDKDGNGFISFREFVDMLIIFAKGKSSMFNGNASIYTMHKAICFQCSVKWTMYT
jgi:hypothetical protein